MINIDNVESIKELVKLREEALIEYHKIAAEIDAKIKQIRTKRNTKLVVRADRTPYFEQGRSIEPTRG